MRPRITPPVSVITASSRKSPDRSIGASLASSTQTAPQTGQAICRSPLAGADECRDDMRVDRESDATGVIASVCGADPAADHAQASRTVSTRRAASPSGPSAVESWYCPPAVSATVVGGVAPGL